MLGPIRYILAALVLLSHTDGYPHGVWPDPGLPAVLVFFAISGYLMPAAFAESYSGRLLSFYKSRALRIFPVYWLALVIAVTLKWDGWEVSYMAENPQAILQNVLLLGLNQAELWGRDVRLIGPAWTLDVELQYYLIAPLLLIALVRQKTLTIALSSAAVLLSLWLALHPTGIRGIDYSLLAWWPFFLVGFLVYAAGYRLPKSFTMPKQPALKLLGDLSFPLYILHRPILEAGIPQSFLAMIDLPMNILTLFLVGLLLCTVASWAAHAGIENRIEKFRKHLRTSPQSQAVRAR